MTEIRFRLNGKAVSAKVGDGDILLDVLRALGCVSVKCGCETTNCGLCTVWIDGKSRLSCAVLAVSVAGCEVCLYLLKDARRKDLHRYPCRCP